MTQRAAVACISNPGASDARPGCITSAYKIRKLLIKRYGFRRKHISLILDIKHPKKDKRFDIGGTSEEIELKLKDMVSESVPGDGVVLFLTGHGGTVEEENREMNSSDYYLECTDDSRIYGSDLQKMIRTIPANLSCTVIVDACFSAGLFEGAAKEQIGPNSTSHIVNHTIHPNAVMIASCCNNQFSIGERFNGFGYHPLFPRFIKRKRGTLFVESLLKAVKRRKRRVTHQGKKRKCRVTNKRLVRRIARLLEKILEKDGETQQPALFCSDTQARLDFLGPIA